MKKVKFYLIFCLVVTAISCMGILLGMFFVVVEDMHPEYLSAGLFRGIIIFIAALLLTVYLHETAHAVAFKMQGIGIRMLYVFPLCIVKEKEGLRIRVAAYMQLGLGGIVIPRIPIINNRLEYECMQKKLSVSLMSGPLCSAFVGAISLIALLFTGRFEGSLFCSYYFLFCLAMLLWFRFFTHAVIYMYFYGDTQDAIILWEEYKENKPTTPLGQYCFEQVELLLYKKNEEK